MPSLSQHLECLFEPSLLHKELPFSKAMVILLIPLDPLVGEGGAVDINLNPPSPWRELDLVQGRSRSQRTR
jgi:hypothetical protein